MKTLITRTLITGALLFATSAFAADSLPDLRQTVGKAFLKTAAASGSWA